MPRTAKPAARRSDANESDDSSSSGADIPATTSKSKINNSNDASADDNSEEGDEDEYAVERIQSHVFDDDGTLRYEVKWEGYEERTWEPEDNLSGCEAELRAYWKLIGGKPKREKKPTSRKRSLGASQVDEAPNKGKKAKGNEASKQRKTDGAMESITDTTGKSKWTAPVGSWEDEIIAIETVEEGGDNRIWGYVMWKNKHKSKHVTAVLNQKCPQKMLAFYESRLIFNVNGSGPAPDTPPDAGSDDESAELGIKDVAMSK